MTTRPKATPGIAAPARRNQAGFTIIEVMIAMTLGLILVGALLVVVLGSTANSATRERYSDLQTNGRYAMQQIKRDLMHAGYLGITSLFFPDQPITPAIAVANACDSASVGQISRRLWGAEDSNPFAATCIPKANYARGDVLLIRGLSPTVAVAPFKSTLVYYHSAYEGGQPFVGPTPPNFNGSSKQPPYLDYRIDETVYYISPYTSSASENPKVPALYRLRLGEGPAMVPELVASGVENLQVRYGVFQTNDTVRYMDADDMTAADWDLVKSVEVALLMRATTSEAGYLNNTTYTMAGDAYAVNDNFPRLLLSAVVQQRN